MAQPQCIYCEYNDTQIPLIPFTFKSNSYWICPQHLPVLIHKPELLAEKLPGLIPSQHSDDE